MALFWVSGLFCSSKFLACKVQGEFAIKPKGISNEVILFAGHEGSERSGHGGARSQRPPMVTLPFGATFQATNPGAG